MSPYEDGAPLMGRERERAVLAGAVDGLANGRGAVVHITGAAGVGKSRVVAEARRASRRRVRWLEGRGLSFSQTIAYWLFIEILREWSGTVDSDDTLESWVKLERGVRAVSGDTAAEILPYLATLLGLPSPSELSGRVRYLDGQAMRRQVMRSMRRWLEDVARGAPVALVLEDVHWIDRSSAELVDHLLPLVESVPLLVCLVGRPAQGTQGASAGAIREAASRFSSSVEIVLEPVAAPVAGGALEAPATPEDEVLDRLDRLDDEMARALKLDAILGPGFLSRTLTALADADQALERHLAARDRGRDAEILVDRLRQLHGRVGECVETLFADRLDELSALLAYHFTRAESWEVAKDYLYRAADHASHIAADSEAVALYRQAMDTHHRVLGDAWDPVDRAVLQRKMGEALWRRGENGDAIDYLERAMSLLGHRSLPRSRGAVRRGIARELAVHAGRRTWERLRRSRGADAETLGTPPRRPTVAEDEAATIVSRIGWIDYFVGTERFLYDLLLLLNESEASGHEYGVAEAEAALGLACDVIPAPRLARGYHRHAVALAEEIGNPVLLGFAYLSLGLHEYYRGRWDVARTHFETSAARYHEAGEIRGWASASQMIAWVLRLQGRFAASITQSQAIVDIGDDAGDRQAVAFALHGIGWTAWSAGDLGEATALLTKAIDLYAALPNDQARAEAMADLGMCRLREGRVDEASALAEDANRIVNAGGLRGFNITRSRNALAEVRLAVAERARGSARGVALRQARAACRAALAQARVDRGGLPAAARSWGTYHWLRGRSRRARTWWTKSVDVATSLGAPLDTAGALLEIGRRCGAAAAIERARRILDQIGAARA